MRSEYNVLMSQCLPINLKRGGYRFEINELINNRLQKHITDNNT